MRARRIRLGLFAILAAGLLLSSAGSSASSAPDAGVPEAGHKLRGVSPSRQIAAGPAAAVVPAWEAFLAELPEAAAVTWNPDSGTPQSLFGRLSEAFPESPEAAARRFLADHAPLFRLTDSLKEIALTSEVETPMGRHFRFFQSYRGIPVAGAEIKVHFNNDGEIVAVNNTSVPDISLSTVRPSLRAREAVAIARAGVPTGPAELEEQEKSAAALVIRAGEGGAALAWEVTLATAGPTWRVFVDAQDGAILATPEDINRYANTGRVFRVNAIVATRDNSLRDQDDAASAVPMSAYSVVSLQGLAGNGFLDGAFASSGRTKKRAFSATNDFLFDRSDDGFSETMGYYALDYAQRYIQTLGFAHVNNRQQEFSVNRFKGDNSFYSPNSRDITFGLGGVDDAEDADVIWHEYGHSIQDDQVPGFGSTLEAGSMGEGFGDYWAGTVGAQLSGGFQDVCLAEWDATSYSPTNPPCLRRLDGTKHYPEDVRGEVHDDGEMWSAALWQIRGAIGSVKADKVVLQAHFLLSPGASFSDGANALVTAARNLGYKTNEVNAMRTILRNRGFTVTS